LNIPFDQTVSHTNALAFQKKQGKMPYEQKMCVKGRKKQIKQRHFLFLSFFLPLVYIILFCLFIYLFLLFLRFTLPKTVTGTSLSEGRATVTWGVATWPFSRLECYVR